MTELSCKSNEGDKGILTINIEEMNLCTDKLPVNIMKESCPNSCKCR